MRPRACEARIVPASSQVRHLKMLRHHQRRSRPIGRGRALPSSAYLTNSFAQASSPFFSSS